MSAENALSEAVRRHQLADARTRDRRLRAFLQPLRWDERARVVIETDGRVERFRVRDWSEVTFTEFTGTLARLLRHRHLVGLMAALMVLVAGCSAPPSSEGLVPCPRPTCVVQVHR